HLDAPRRPLAVRRRACDTELSMSTHLARLKQLNARFIHNFVTNDVASHAAITHENFLHMTVRGGRQNRADYLKAWASGFDPEVIVYWDYRDERSEERRVGKECRS